MNKKDIELLAEAWGGRGEYQPKPSNEYGPFTLSPEEKNIVDAYIGRTKLVDFLRFIKQHKPEIFNNVIEEIVLMNVKDPGGM